MVALGIPEALRQAKEAQAKVGEMVTCLKALTYNKTLDDSVWDKPTKSLIDLNSHMKELSSLYECIGQCKNEEQETEEKSKQDLKDKRSRVQRKLARLMPDGVAKTIAFAVVKTGAKPSFYNAGEFAAAGGHDVPACIGVCPDSAATPVHTVATSVPRR